MANDAKVVLASMVKEHGEAEVVKLVEKALKDRAYRKNRQMTERALLEAAKSDARFMETAGARVLAKKSA
jgi:lactam utilization protein B